LDVETTLPCLNVLKGRIKSKSKEKDLTAGELSEKEGKFKNPSRL